MKKNIILLILLVFLMTGCFGTSEVEDIVVPGADNTVSTEVNIPDDSMTKKFYPDALTVKKPVSINSFGDSSDSFVITQELQVKLFLVDRYNPGTCYGIPGPVPAVAIASMISKNLGLVKFLRQQYSLPADFDVYSKIKQINGINLTEVAGGNYEFKFIDGQCCTLNVVGGTIQIIGQSIDHQVTNQESKNNPC
jgi:hypothetical protein